MKTKPSECPSCLNVLDRVTSAGEKAEPKPGAFSVCNKCGAMLRFDELMELEPMNDDDLAQLTAEAPAIADKLRNLSDFFKNVVRSGAKTVIMDDDDINELVDEIVADKTSRRRCTRPR